MGIHYPLETPRLQLLPFTATDGDALYTLESDPAVKRFTGGVLTRQETEKLLQSFIKQFEQTGSGAIAIKRKDHGQMIGLCGLVPDGPDGELFFGLARSAWQQASGALGGGGSHSNSSSAPSARLVNTCSWVRLPLPVCW